MIEDKGSLFKRFRVWLANLIGGKDYAWEMESLYGAIEGWRKVNAALKEYFEASQSPDLLVHPIAHDRLIKARDAVYALLTAEEPDNA